MAQQLSQAFQAFGALVLAFLLGVAIYVGVSYALMRSHAAERTSLAHAREAFRESFLAGLISPLLPLYYLVGHRMGGAPWDETRDEAPVPVVFVHGYMQNRVGFIGLARALRADGIGPLYGFNYPWFASIPSNASRLERFIAEVCAETKAEKVDVVCHSMGGLIGVEMLLRGSDRVRRFVTIASPHAGVVWRGPLLGFGASSLRRGSKLLEGHAGAKLAIPTLSIFSTHDNVVHPKETSSLVMRGGRDFEIEGPGHFAILFSKEVARAVIDFLREPASEVAPVRIETRVRVDDDVSEALAEAEVEAVTAEAEAGAVTAVTGTAEPS